MAAAAASTAVAAASTAAAAASTTLEHSNGGAASSGPILTLGPQASGEAAHQTIASGAKLTVSSVSFAPLAAPFRCGPFTVRPDWIDENNHLNLAHYITLFDWATDALWPSIGLGAPLRATGRGTFAAETHILYRAELVQGETVSINSHLLAVDAKRLHLAHEMRRERDGVVSAQQEIMFLSVDLGSRRVSPWPDAIRAALDAAVSAHAGLERPDWVGRQVAMPTRA